MWRRQKDGKCVGRVKVSEYGEDGKCVGIRCAIAQGGRCGVRTQGTTIIRAREKPMVRWQRGEGVGHGTSLPGTAWTWHCDIRGAHGDHCEVR